MTRLASLAFPLFALLAVTGCTDHGPKPPVLAGLAQQGIPVAQSFSISIDNQPLVMTPDAPRDGHVIVASIVGSKLTISAMDRTRDFMMSIQVQAPGGAPIKPAIYDSYICRPALGCDPGATPAPPGSTLLKFPGTPYQPTDVKSAHLAPALGLAPLKLTLEKVEDVIWPGAGPSKRIKGTFSGTVAFVEEPRDAPPRIVGKTRQVEGSFDLYTVLR